MRIGIDIDGVLTNIEQYCLDYLTKYCIENNIEYKLNSSDYNIAKAFNITKEQEQNFWNEYLVHYAINEKARPFAKEVIKKLKDMGHEIYIITARTFTNKNDAIGKNMQKLVINWLEKNTIVYDKLIFAKSSKQQKTEEILEYNIDLMIEDNPTNINSISKLIPVICYHTNYNIDCNNDNVIRCYSWYEIYKYIINL